MRAARHLLLLLSGKAQLAALDMPAGALADYASLWATIWEWVGLKLEGHERRLRELSFLPVGRPFTYAQQLLDSCWNWLPPETRMLHYQGNREAGGTGAIYNGAPDWLWCHQPISLSVAIELAVNHLSVGEDTG